MTLPVVTAHAVEPAHVAPSAEPTEIAAASPAPTVQRQPLVPSEPSLARRPGLDLHAALSDTRISLGPTAAAAVSAQHATAPARVQRTEVVSPPDRRPGLDLQHALAAPARVQRAEPVPPPDHRLPGLDLQRALTAPAPRSALQLAPSPAPQEEPQPAAPPPAPPTPPPLAAVPAAASPPPVQRVETEVAEHTRKRLHEAPDDELEELADRLYDHIRARFRTELLIDRERAGLLADRY